MAGMSTRMASTTGGSGIPDATEKQPVSIAKDKDEQTGHLPGVGLGPRGKVARRISPPHPHPDVTTACT